MAIFHNHRQLTNIIQLQFLKTCLKVKGLVLVNYIPITENNFVLAWDLLDELSDIIIGKILIDKLDKTTKRSWNMTIDSNHIPSCSELLKLLENHAKALNTSETENRLPLIKRSMKLQVHNLTKANWFLCQQEHALERMIKVKQLKLCLNCLRNNHPVNKCKSEFKCRKCQEKHNTLVYIDAAIHQFK
ncbi:hypothetical protein LAZ67_2005476 [Cordylochernes scorpioides]|uniref:Uncharacterized protein n=1 Tax=Cordylochernes scorpioides TaxID=51811 RepID=A0ABY6K5E1_9ARAC|nr:hypothetical protein LAZ67_2005476 [Cordylochernes scorpioides]